MTKKTTVKEINQILIGAGFSNLKAGKPSLLSPFVIVEGVDLWNNRLATFNTVKKLKAFVLGLVQSKN